MQSIKNIIMQYDWIDLSLMAFKWEYYIVCGDYDEI